MVGLQLSLDAPSPHTGTGTKVVLDGEDVAMVRATLTDGEGHLVPTNLNISFVVTSGPGRIVTPTYSPIHLLTQSLTH